VSHLGIWIELNAIIGEAERLLKIEYHTSPARPALVRTFSPSFLVSLSANPTACELYDRPEHVERQSTSSSCQGGSRPLYRHRLESVMACRVFRYIKLGIISDDTNSTMRATTLRSAQQSDLTASLKEPVTRMDALRGLGPSSKFRCHRGIDNHGSY
jgi:hypothetical protein